MPAIGPLDQRRRRPRSVRTWRSGVGRALPVLAVALAAAWAAMTTPYEAAGPAIRSDGSGYQAWTRAIVTGDYSFCGNEELLTVKAISATDAERDVCQNKYPPGMALLRLPVTGWLVDRGATDPRPSPREQEASLWLGAATLAATAALVADAARRLGARVVPSAVALLCGTFGTGLFHYATYDGSFSHGSSAMLVAALCWVGVRASGGGRPPPLVPTAVLTALLTLTRNTNVVVVASLVVGWLAWQHVPFWRLGPLLRHAGPAVAGGLVGAAVQVGYNRWATGSWTLSSYGSEPFLFDRPRQHSVLVSYERGLLTWYPALAVGLVALALTRRGRHLGALALVLVVPLVVIYGFWFSWYLGGGFGHRGFVEVVPALVLAFAVGLDELRGPARHLVAGAMVLATLVTVSLMAGYWRSSIDFIGTRDDVYWAHVVGGDSILTP